MAGPALEGLLALDAAGGIAAALGRGAERPVQAALLRPGYRETLRRRRLGSLSDLGLAVLWSGLPEGELFLLSAARQTVLEFLAGIDFAYDILEHLLTDPFDAMTVVDAEARVAYIAPVHEGFFGLTHGAAVGRPVNEVIENTRLDQVVRSGKAEVAATQSMRGVTRVVNRTPIRGADGSVKGAIGRVLFKGPRQLEALNQRINALENEVAFYRREARAARERSYGLEDLIGESPAMQRLRRQLVQVAPLDVPVLVAGDSGVGKELVTQALHRLSPRREGPLVAVNAAALPDSLVESELFGYEGGAFTGADRRGRAGKFEQAAGGTLFLDEIGEMPLAVQAKLLRVLQDGKVERLGGDGGAAVDFRLVTATNARLEERVEAGSFRLDLFYRISPVVLRVPSLAERLEDLPALVRHFLDDFAERHGRPRLEVTPGALAALAARPWPGNLRQLKHAVERAAIFAGGVLLTEAGFEEGALPGEAGGERLEPLSQTLGRVEEQAIRAALEASGGNKQQAARRLGISRSYLYKKLG